MAAKTKQNATGSISHRVDYWLKFVSGANLIPSRILDNTPDNELGMLAELKGCPQDQEWHPEGDVWVHTGQVCDIMRVICTEERVDDRVASWLMLAAPLHDCAKPETTCWKLKYGVERLASPRHAIKGAAKARKWLAVRGFDEDTQAVVGALVYYHMSYLDFREWDGREHTRIYNLAYSLEPATVYQLALLVEADTAGRVVDRSTLTRIGVPAAQYMSLVADECHLLHGFPPK